MAKRWFSLLLALALCLGVAPFPAARAAETFGAAPLPASGEAPAEEGTAELFGLSDPEGELLFRLISITDAGAAQMDDWASGEYISVTGAGMGMMNPDTLKGRLMVRAMHFNAWSEDSPIAYFFRPSEGGSVHELTLYGVDDLAAGDISIGGVTLLTDLERHVYGDGGDELYWYTAKIRVPEEDSELIIAVKGERYATLPLIHVGGQAPLGLFSTFAVYDYTENARDPDCVETVTLRISGFSLPEDAAEYNLTWQTYDEETKSHVYWYAPGASLTEPDETGCRLLTFDFHTAWYGDEENREVVYQENALGVPGMDLMWSNLTLGKVDPDTVEFPEPESYESVFFGDYPAWFFSRDNHLEQNAQGRWYFPAHYDNDYPGGVEVSMPVPYYCIFKELPPAPAVTPAVEYDDYLTEWDAVVSHDDTVTVTLRPGSYAGGMVKLTVNGFDASEWTAAEEDMTLQVPLLDWEGKPAGEYGVYPVGIRFRKAGLRGVTAGAEVYYSDTAPSALTEGIVTDAAGEEAGKNDSGAYILRGTEDKIYRFSAALPTGWGSPDLTWPESQIILFEFYDAEGVFLTREGTYSKDAREWSVDVPRSEILEAEGVRIYNSGRTHGYTRPGGALEFALANIEPYYLRTEQAPGVDSVLKADAGGEPYRAVKVGAAVSAIFEASDGEPWQHAGELDYTDTAGATRTLTLAEERIGKRSFRVSAAVPADAAALGELRYTLTDGESGESDTLRFDLSEYRVSGAICFTGIPALLEGKTFRFRSLPDGNGVSAVDRSFVLTAENRACLEVGEVPEDYYTWEISGRSGHIVGVEAGPANLAGLRYTRGMEKDISAFFEDLALCSLTVNTEGFVSEITGGTVNPPAKVTLTVTTPDLQEHKVTGVTGVPMADIPRSSSVTVALSYEDPQGEISACVPEVGTPESPFNITGDLELDYTYKPFTYRTVSGHIWAQKTTSSGYVSGFVPWDAVITLTQEVNRGGETETCTLTATPTRPASGNLWDAGNFSFRCYDNIPATVEIRSMSWRTVTRTVTAAGDQSLGDITLEPGGEQVIVVSASAATPQTVWEDGTPYFGEPDSVTVPLDTDFLNIYQIGVDGRQYGASSGAYETCTAAGKTVVTIHDGIITTGGAAIWLYAYGSTQVGGVTLNIPLGSQTKQVKSQGGLLQAQFEPVYQGGELRTTVVDADDSEMTGFLIYQNSRGKASYVSGKGELRLSYPQADAGDRTVLTLMVADRDAAEMARVLDSEFDKVLTQAKTWEASRYQTILSRTVNLRDGCYVYLKKEMRPAAPIRGELLSPWLFDYYITLGTTADTVRMVGTLTKRFPETPDADYLECLKIYTVTETGERLSVPFTVEGEEAGLVTDVMNHVQYYSWVVRHYTHAADYRPEQVTVAAELPLHGSFNAVNFEMDVMHHRGALPAYAGSLTRTLSFSEEIPMFQLSVPGTVSLLDEMAARGLAAAPAEQQAAWTLNVGVRAFISDDPEENVITIWDNGVAVDTFTVAAGAYPNSTVIGRPVRLVNNLKPGVHVLWATRTYNGETMSTEPRAFNLIHEAIEQVYISDLRWTHYNHRLPNDRPDDYYFRNLSDMAGETFWIWPGKRSDMSLILHNALGSEVEGVSLIVHRRAQPAPAFTGTWQMSASQSSTFFSGIPARDDVFSFTWVGDNAAAHTSTWRLTDVNLGWFEWFQFQVDMKLDYKVKRSGQSDLDYEEETRRSELSAAYRANGLGEVPDDTEMVDALATLTGDQLQETLSERSAALPEELMGLDFQVTKNTATDYEVSLKTPTADVKDYRLTIHEGPEVSVDEVWDLMEYERAYGSQNPAEAGWDVYWAELDGLQGSTLIRMAVNNERDAQGNYALTMHKTAYITAAVADAVENGTSIAEAEAARLMESASLMGLYDKGEPPAHWTKKTYDVTSYIYTGADLTQDLYVGALKGTYTDKKVADAVGENAKFIPKQVGDVMNVLGVVDAAVSISGGPSGNDTNGLYYLLNNVKDRKFRAAIEQQLRDYDELRMDIYAQDTAISAIGAGANFVPDPTPLTKIVCFLGSLGNGVISGYAKDYNRQVYNTTFLDIQRQIKLEQYKEMRAAADEDFKNMVRRRFGKDVADDERRLREEKKYWYLTIDEFGDYKWRLKQNCPEFNTYQDPSGFVFEAVEENRIEGVTATLYYSETRDGSYSVWADPNRNVSQRQFNPLSTTDEGRYQWMVPSGWWKVRYEKEGYLPAETKPMNVPPIHTAVNIGLLSTEAPRVTVIPASDGTWTLVFSKYMQLESLLRPFGDEGYDADSFDAASFSVRFLDAEGETVRGTVTFPDRRANTGYVDGPYMQDVIPSIAFVRTAIFTPVSGQTAVSWELGEGIVSYAGVALDTVNSGDTGVYLASLDAAGGVLSTAVAITDSEGRLPALPQPAREDYSFVGWFTEEGAAAAEGSVLSENTALRARWTALCSLRLDSSGDTPSAEVAGAPSGSRLILAYYDGSGRLLSTEVLALPTGGSLSRPITVGEARKIKAFLTDADGKPITEAMYFRP